MHIIYKGGIIMYQEWIKTYDEVVNKASKKKESDRKSNNKDKKQSD